MIRAAFIPVWVVLGAVFGATWVAAAVDDTPTHRVSTVAKLMCVDEDANKKLDALLRWAGIEK